MYQIIKQPNNKFCVFSTSSDSFLLINADKKDLIKFFLDMEKERIKRFVSDKTTLLNNNEKPYFQFTLSFDDAINKIKSMGSEQADIILELTTGK